MGKSSVLGSGSSRQCLNFWSTLRASQSSVESQVHLLSPPPSKPLLLIHPFLSFPPSTGVLTLLKFPYPREVEEPECYDSIRVHAEWGQPQADQEDSKPVFSVRLSQYVLSYILHLSLSSPLEMLCLDLYMVHVHGTLYV